MTPKVRNQSSDQWCDACGNTGWAELAGTIQEFGHTYSQGQTPCKWCEQGAKRYAWATSPRSDVAPRSAGQRRRSSRRDQSHADSYEPVSDFDWPSITPVGARHRPAEPRKLATLFYQLADEISRNHQVDAAGPRLRYTDPPWVIARRHKRQAPRVVESGHDA